MTAIEWTDETWNPVRGCSRVSAGCDNCYAMGQAHRYDYPANGKRKAGPYEGLTTIRRGKVDWVGHTRLVPEVLERPLRWKRPRRIFVNSMSDLFHSSLSNEDIAAIFGVMAACPQHTFQVLTKRPKRMKEWFEWILGSIGAREMVAKGITAGGPEAQEETFRVVLAAADAIRDHGIKLNFALSEPWPLPNIWLGVSCEDQEQADKRIPLLLETPAAVRFVSLEPLLCPIDLRHLPFGPSEPRSRVLDALTAGHKSATPWHLNGVIVGGESGSRARPCHIEWIRSILGQCKAAGVACFVKQLGSTASEPAGSGHKWMKLRDKKGGDPSEWPEDLRVREFPRCDSPPHTPS